MLEISIEFFCLMLDFTFDSGTRSFIVWFWVLLNFIAINWPFWGVSLGFQLQRFRLGVVLCQTWRFYGIESSFTDFTGRSFCFWVFLNAIRHNIIFIGFDSIFYRFLMFLEGSLGSFVIRVLLSTQATQDTPQWWPGGDGQPGPTGSCTLGTLS